MQTYVTKPNPIFILLYAFETWMVGLKDLRDLEKSAAIMTQPGIFEWCLLSAHMQLRDARLQVQDLCQHVGNLHPQADS